nr:ATP-binding cassette domain-containing protein [Microbacterium amylolyticum]
MVFGDVPAVDGLTARIEPGRVTAFLGPNGAGKTTTLRILLGDLRPTRGKATIDGKTYHQIVRPGASIGAILSVDSFQRFRRKTATKYLTKAAKQIGIGAPRVAEVLTVVGLGEMGDMRIDSLSLGMKHRLAVAEALLGDPAVLVFDEPANGLDPEGIRWIRLLMRRFADEGRTVLMSSHVLSEVEQVADSLIILNEGQLLFEGPIELLSEAEGGLVTVDADDRVALLELLDDNGYAYRVLRSGIAIDGTTTSEIGALATAAGVPLRTLTHRGPSLEDVYLQIIDGTWSAPARTAALDPTAFAAASAVAEDEPVAEEPAHDEPEASESDVAEVIADGTPAEEDAEDEIVEIAASTGVVATMAGAATVLPGAASLAALASDLRDEEDEAAEDAEESDDAEAATDVPPRPHGFTATSFRS